MRRWEGKKECINGTWYPVIVTADSLKSAIGKLYVGKRNSYGVVERVRGRWHELR